jgi:hypothetical protein
VTVHNRGNAPHRPASMRQAVQSVLGAAAQGRFSHLGSVVATRRRRAGKQFGPYYSLIYREDRMPEWSVLLQYELTFRER